MKKRIIIVLIAVLSAVLIIASLTDGFKKSALSGKIYRPQNVYDEIWNLLTTEQYTRNKTILTTSTTDAYEDWDLGIDFVGIIIPECDMTIHWQYANDEKYLSFLFYPNKGEYVCFVYNYKEKTMFGEAEFSYLMENFLVDYFAWCEAAPDFSSSYSAESLGSYTFQYRNPLRERELRG